MGNIFLYFLILVTSHYQSHYGCKREDGYQKRDKSISICQFHKQLELSIKNRDLNRLKILMETNNIDPFYKLKYTKTIFHFAIKYGGEEIFDYFLSKVKDINRKLFYYEQTILDYLLHIKDLKKTQFYNATDQEMEYYINKVKKRGGIELEKLKIELYKAIIEGNEKKIKSIVKIDGIDFSDSIAYAFDTKSKDELLKFLGKITKRDGIDYSKYLPCIIFDIGDKYIDLLLSFKNINETELDYSILFCSMGDFKLFKKMVKKGANINQIIYAPYLLNDQLNRHPDNYYYYYYTPLRLSIIIDSINITNYLLKKDVVVEKEDIIAAFFSKKYLKYIKLLLKYGVSFKHIISTENFYHLDKFLDKFIVFDYNKDKRYDTTLLILALQYKKFELVKLIVDKSYINFIEYGKHTALDYAYKLKNKEIIKLLRKHGAKRGCELLNKKCEREIE